MGNRRAITLLIYGTVLLSVLRFIALPTLDYRDDMQKRTTRTYKMLGKVTELAQEYTQLQTSRKALSSGGAAHQGTLFAIVEEISRKQKINSLIVSVRPQQKKLENELVEEKIQIRFENLYQLDLLHFLYSVEKKMQGITVLNLEIQRTQGALLNVDVSLCMATPDRL
ncbi:type II secretion system protein M [Halodesulfovibrio marinisediminis]|uniref:Type II secretion system (T2SS), protein M n=1 Tax=Halodesulfovibrio marinisediminis DSM 17456 TaxID=1121457 RepID=A0A1N6H0C7_9BACT|nr:type II secretion system protein M [Halodesulfovibrio marinisediminis]SIO13209.1 Type II secretion system (T2SS), protein M [Halodesulfovibrio marinisediminis DSM 17456]